MGRAGRVAPRICSVTHVTSSLTVSLPAGCKGVMVQQQEPASPGTPGQVAPASVRPVMEAWPQDALQVVQRQMEALSEAASSSSSSSSTTTRKRELEEEDGCQGLEVLLQTQPALPNDWEQFLDLKTGQFYYMHWSSCKRSKRDPRPLVREADQAVEAHLREAHVRGESHVEVATTAPCDEYSSDDEESEACSAAPDVCERTSSVAGAADRELGSDDVDVCEKKKKQPEQAVMVVSGCHSCSMFVMVCLSSPACPSCGAPGGIR